MRGQHLKKDVCKHVCGAWHKYWIPISLALFHQKPLRLGTCRLLQGTVVGSELGTHSVNDAHGIGMTVACQHINLSSMREMDTLSLRLVQQERATPSDDATDP